MPDFELKDRYDLNDFRRLVAVLRAPGGCPWDAEQTHESFAAARWRRPMSSATPSTPATTRT